VLCFFIFSFFPDFLCPFESWSNPRFDQDLNKQFKNENEEVSLDPS
jgi:hypothetical protein